MTERFDVSFEVEYLHTDEWIRVTLRHDGEFVAWGVWNTVSKTFRDESRDRDGFYVIAESREDVIKHLDQYHAIPFDYRLRAEAKWNARG